MLDPREEARAAELIRAAVTPAATVARSGGAVEVRYGDRHARLHFVPADAGAGAGTVRVLRRGGRAGHGAMRSRGESFVDLGGTVFLALDGLLVDRTGVTVPSASRVRLPFDPFADRASLVARAMLADAKSRARSWGIREVARAAAISPATAMRAVHALAGLGLVDAARAGREARVRLRDPRALLLRWSGAYDWTRNAAVAFHAPVGDPQRFLPRLREALAGRCWALTLHAGAALVAPHATWTRLHAYVDAPPAALVALGEAAGWERGDDGAVVLLRPAHRRSAWHGMREVGGIPVAGWVQLVLDLWHHPVRGREQAGHLLASEGLGERP